MIHLRATLLLLALALAGCHSAQVTTDYDKTVDFKKYKTYAWHPQGMTTVGIPIQRAQLAQGFVKAAVDREFSLRGIKSATYGPPDFFVTTTIGAVNTTNVQRWGKSEGGFLPGSDVPVREEDVREGSIVLNFVDNQNGLPFWQGTAQSAVQSTDNMKDRIEAIVKQMFANYPPK